MKQLKCENCGATIEIIDNDKDFAICPYCKAKYQLNEKKDINIKIDDNTKELLTNGLNIFNKSSKFTIIPIIMFSLIVITSIIIISINAFSQINENNKEINKTNNTVKTQETNDTDKNQEANEIKKTVSKTIFNSKFEFHSGTKYKSSVEYLLDDIVTNNKTNKDMLITLIYKDKETTDPETIIDIKHALNDKIKYEVKLDYDDDGYVYKITIEDI